MRPFASLLAIASTLVVVSTAPALAGNRGVSEREMVQKFMRIFDRLDRNHNNRISRSGLRNLESRSGHGSSSRIRVVFGDENFRIAFGTSGGNHRGGSSYLGPINSRTFHLYDLNHDGYIYRKELRRAVINEFHRADRNGNGYLSQKELNRSNWYRTSHARTHARYYPDYRRPVVIHHRDGRRDTRRGNHRDPRRDAHRNDRRRDTHKVDHRNGRKDGRRDGRKGDHRDGHNDGNRDGRRDGHSDRDDGRDGRRDDAKDGHRDGDHKAKKSDRDRKQDRKDRRKAKRKNR